MSRVPADLDVFHAVADRNRRRILDLLIEHEGPVKDLLPSFGISQPSVSEHLRILRNVGLVEARKRGRMRIYRVVPQRLKDIADWLTKFDDARSRPFGPIPPDGTQPVPSDGARLSDRPGAPAPTESEPAWTPEID